MFTNCFIDTTVILTPSGNVSVCPGSQLSFRCNTNRSFLEWNITAYQSGTSDSKRHILTSISQSHAQLTINGSSFSITRISADGFYPIVSTMTTDNVLANPIKIRCTGHEVGSSFSENSTSVATVNIIMPSQGMYIFLLSLKHLFTVSASTLG